MSRVIFLGSGDAFAAGGRAHGCCWVEDSLGCYTVDFGPTALVEARRLGLDPGRLDGVLFTHLHGDHIGGLPLLLIDLQFRAGRSRPLWIAGPPGSVARTGALMAACFPETWAAGLAFRLEHHLLAVPGTTEVAGREVRAIRARHQHLELAASLRITSGGTSLAFSGDTGWQPALAELSAGVDLFVCECSQAEPFYGGHLSLEELAAHRAELTPRRLVLTHLGESTLAARERIPALDAELAEEGLVVELPGPFPG